MVSFLLWILKKNCSEWSLSYFEYFKNADKYVFKISDVIQCASHLQSCKCKHDHANNLEITATTFLVNM